MKNRQMVRFIFVTLLCLLLAAPALAAVLVLPEGTKVIGEEAFFGDTSLDEVVLPDGIEQIGDRAFAESSLNRINLPESLKEIAESALDHGKEIEVTALKGSYAYEWAVREGFIDESQIPAETPAFYFMFSDNPDGTCSVSGYWGDFTEVIVPAKDQEGRTVTGIKGNAFWTDSLTALILPDTVKTIETYAIRNCGSLTELTIPETVENLPSYAVWNCPKLTKVKSPMAWDSSTVFTVFYECGIEEFEVIGSNTEIPEYCFSGNAFPSLKKVILPAQTVKIGESAFAGCKNLETILFGADTVSGQFPETLKAIDDSAFYRCEALKTLTFPRGLETIGHHAFADCSNLTNVTFNGVETIADSAFYNCTGLKEISFPSTLKSVGELAFAYCSELTSVKFSKGLQSIGPMAFHFCSKLETAELPEGLRSIGDDAFLNCTALKEEELPDGLESIGAYAFSGCSAIESIIIPDTVTSIGTSAFSGTGIRRVKSPVAWTVMKDEMIHQNDDPFYGCSIEEFEIAESTTVIPDHVFGLSAYTESLKKVILPESLLEIGRRAFWDCANLTELTTRGSNVNGQLPEGLLKIGKEAFYGCTGLTALYIPETVTSLEDLPFYGCNNLKRIKMPLTSDNSTLTVFPDLEEIEITAGSVTKIPDYFCGGSPDHLQKLTKVILPDTITEIGDYAFADCSKLTLLQSGNHTETGYLPNALTAIGTGAFRNCSGAFTENLVIPENVVTLGRGAFENCGGIRLVKGPILSGWSDSFSGCTIDEVEVSGGFTQVPEYFFSASVFTNSLKKVVLPAGITEIGTGAFSNCVMLESITFGTDTVNGRFPEGLHTIGQRAFSGCSNLTNAELPKGLQTVDQYVFNGCIGLTNVVFPVGLQTIGQRAFYGCSNLTDAVFQSGLVTIDQEAFSGCSKLTNVVFPNGLETIGINAFFGCSSLNCDLIIPETVTGIGGGAFENCTSLSKVKTPLVWKYAPFSGCPVETFEITNELTVLPEKTFSGFTELKTVKLPGTITEIGFSAFSGCGKLESLFFGEGAVSGHFPEGLKTISANAFSGCGSLEQIEFPEGLETISGNAFCGCEKLSVILIPDTVTSIGSYAFSDCGSLERVKTPAAWNFEATWGHPFNGSSVREIEITGTFTSLPSAFFKKDSYTESLQAVILPDTITEIGDSAFEGCKELSALIFGRNTVSGYMPEGLTAIGKSAFQGCSKLPNLILPESFATMGQDAFTDCVNLKTVKGPITGFVTQTPRGQSYPFIGCSLEEVEITGTVASIPEQFFHKPVYTDSLRQVILPETIAEIGSEAFWECSKLEVIKFGKYSANGHFPETLKTVGSSAFSGCTGLKCNLVFPETMTSIGSRAFSGCSGVTYIQSPIVWNAYEYPFSGCSVEEFRVLGTPATLPSEIFRGMQTLKKVILPDTITKIYSLAFMNCQNLSELYFGAAEISGIFPEGLISIGESAFYNCKKLTNIEFPAELKTIGKNAFQNCSGLTELEFPKHLQAIGDYAFAGCSGLISVDFPENLQKIPFYAFNGCSSLRELIIPESVTQIADGAFKGCSGLTYIKSPVFPRGSTWHPFEGCTKVKEIELSGQTSTVAINIGPLKTSLEKVTLPDTTVEIASSVFSGCTSLSALYFGNNPESGVFPEGLKAIGNEAFSGCSQLSYLEFPDGLKTIGSYAFSGCKGMTDLVIPETVNSIGSDAFKNWPDLKRVKSPFANVFSGCSIEEFELTNAFITRIANETFSNDVFTGSLYKVVLPDTVTEICTSAFEGCASLEELYFGTDPVNGRFPEGITSIGLRAFKGCSSLQSVILQYGLRSIGSEAFQDCSDLYSVELPYGLQIIDISAFNDCSQLTSLTFPESIQTISSFVGCSSLETIYVPESVSSIINGSFTDCPDLNHIYCVKPSYAWNWFSRNGFSEQLVPWTGSSESEPVNVTRIDIDPDSGRIYVGDSMEFFADVSPSRATLSKVKWSVTSDTGTGTITQNGLFTAVSEGTVTIRATATDGSEVYGEAEISILGSDSLRTVSGTVTTEQGEPVKSVVVSAVNQENKRDSKSAVTDSHGKWNMELLEDSVFDITYEHMIYSVRGQQSSVTAGADGCEALTATASIEGETNSKYSFTINNEDGTELAVDENNLKTTSVNTKLHFNVTAPECSRVRLIVDGVIYESYKVSNGSASFTRTMNRAKDTPRVIKFQVLKNDDRDYSSFTPSQKLMVTSTGKLNKAVIHPIESFDMYGSDPLTISWDEVEHAVGYNVYFYHEGMGRLFPSNAESALTYTTETSFIYSPDYPPLFEGDEWYVEVVAVGEVGWDQSTSASDHFTVTGNNIKALSGWVDKKSISLCLGESMPLNGQVVSKLKGINSIRIAIKKANSSEQAAEYAYKDFNSLKPTEISLSEWNIFTLDTGREPLNEAGDYVLTLWASTEGRNDVKLDSMSIKVVAKLDAPNITYPAANGDEIPFGDITVTWDPVPGAGYYVVSLRDMLTEELILNHYSIDDETSMILPASYFPDDADYRLAVGAVYAGFSSTDSSTGWKERVFHVRAEENPEFSVVSGELYEEGEIKSNALSRQYSSFKYITNNGRFPSSNVTVEAYKITETTEETKPSVSAVSDENGHFEMQLQFNTRYRLTFSRGKNNFQIDTIIFTNEAYIHLDNIYLRAQSMLKYGSMDLSGMQSGLFAEYFAYESKGDGYKDSSSNKRNEGIVEKVDFSWKHDNQKTHGYNMMKDTVSGNVIRYIGKKFAARFSGYLSVSRLEQNLDGTLYLRFIADDGVKINLESGQYYCYYSIDHEDWEKMSWLSFGIPVTTYITLSELKGTETFKLTIDYYNAGGTSLLRMEYSDDGKNWKTVPDYCFYNRGASTERTVYSYFGEGMAVSSWLFADDVAMRTYSTISGDVNNSDNLLYTAGSALAISIQDWIRNTTYEALENDPELTVIASAHAGTEIRPTTNQAYKNTEERMDRVLSNVHGVNSFKGAIKEGFEKAGDLANSILDNMSSKQKTMISNINKVIARVCYRELFGVLPSYGSTNTERMWQAIWQKAEEKYNNGNTFNRPVYSNSNSVEQMEYLCAYLYGTGNSTAKNSAGNILLKFAEDSETIKNEYGYNLGDFMWDLCEKVPFLGSKVGELHSDIDQALEFKRVVQIAAGDAEIARAMLSLAWSEKGSSSFHNSVFSAVTHDQAETPLFKAGTGDTMYDVFYTKGGAFGQINTKDEFDNKLDKVRDGSVLNTLNRINGINPEKIIHNELLLYSWKFMKKELTSILDE